MSAVIMVLSDDVSVVMQFDMSLSLFCECLVGGM